MSSIMRQHVPKLTDDISNNEFLDLIVDCFHSAIFGTVDENWESHTNVIDIDFNENERLIFATTNQKSFYCKFEEAQSCINYSISW